MIENVSTQLTVFHCLRPLPASRKAFASLYVLPFLEKEAVIGGRDILQHNNDNFQLKNMFVFLVT